MVFADIQQIFGLPLRRHKAALPAALPYRLTVLCLGDHIKTINRLIENELSASQVGLIALDVDGECHGTLTQITVRLDCTVADRACLVRLVSRLGIENAVKRVSWEGVREGNRRPIKK